jgi:prepilin-type N-terminal cleavage/methylation domain-containing protein
MKPRHGFTLIELLVVIVIIGILASIANVRLRHARERAYLAAMQNDLKVLSIQEELFYGRNFGYTTALDSLPFQKSPGVTLSITSADRAGWAATATHEALASAQCGLFMGDEVAANASPATTVGEIACTY